jgi:transcriptional regulator GlxA family with amidase domain
MHEACTASEQMVENCLCLARVLLHRLRASILSAPEAGGSAQQTCRRGKEYIERNFATIHGLSSVAGACSVTVPHLCRLFEQFGGVSPHDYLTACRLRMAERLLLSSSDSIENIAAAVGYRDWRLLGRNFKARYGDSPERYRKRLRASGAEDRRLRMGKRDRRGTPESRRR